MKIELRVIPNSEQRYKTAGDWQWKGDDLSVKASILKDWRMEACVLVHELIEALVCKHQGVTTESVDEYDLKMTAAGVDDPGGEKDCPYNQAHEIATAIELQLAIAFGLNWRQYGDAVDDSTENKA